LAGKITSFTIAVPAAQLYAREIYLAITGSSRNSRAIKVSGPLRKEIEYWRFLDSWDDCLPWPLEKHTVIQIFSDSSDFAWGGVIHPPHGPPFSIHDYWGENDRSSPIVVKEAKALLMVLHAGKERIANSRIDVHTDNMAFMHSWRRQGGRNRELNDVLKQLYSTLLSCKAMVSFYYIPSERNPADLPSRVLSDKDCSLTMSAWAELEEQYGPHTIDLMSLDSNARRDSSGHLLRHFTPFPTPMSQGVNIFAQHIAPAENAYVFPPFVLIGPVLKFLRESRCTFTIVVPKLHPLPFWWPLIYSYAQSSFLLGRKGDAQVLLFPSTQGSFIAKPLQWDLVAFRVAISD
jgi:hypothetical protein